MLFVLQWYSSSRTLVCSKGIILWWLIILQVQVISLIWGRFEHFTSFVSIGVVVTLIGESYGTYYCNWTLQEICFSRLSGCCVIFSITASMSLSLFLSMRGIVAVTNSFVFAVVLPLNTKYERERGFWNAVTWGIGTFASKCFYLREKGGEFQLHGTITQIWRYAADLVGIWVGHEFLPLLDRTLSLWNWVFYFV